MPLFQTQSRLDRMLYVGLTEEHEESARLFAHMVGAQVLSQSGALNLDIKDNQPTGNGKRPHKLAALRLYVTYFQEAYLCSIYLPF